MRRTLVARDVRRVYTNSDGRELVALDGFSIDVDHGEIVAIVGPSGCGKSTFLRLVAGLDMPQGGEVIYGGTKVDGTDPDRGFVFQDSTLFPWLTVKGNISFGLKVRGVYKEQESRVQEMVDLMGLTGFEDSYPHQISGGMASRTSLARTFIQSPGLILLDEPLSALDAFTRAAIQDEVLSMWKINEPIILLVTHDIEEAVYLSDRVVVMSPRPGRAVGEVVVDLPHPRDRTSDEFIEKRREILGILNF